MAVGRHKNADEMQRLDRRMRNTSRPVVLVGFLDQGNLGLGYLTATLRRFGYRVVVVDIERPKEEMLEIIRTERPLMIGFSMIFQFYVDRYDRLLRYLRRRGVDCHFTMGGHFPSLSHDAAMRALPALDSIVQFEGELTLLHIADRISTGREWRDVPGLVCWRKGEITVNPPGMYLHDLDWLPWPDRDYEPEKILGLSAMPLLASRGCARTCSFCSIHTFYRTAPGKVVRIRNPARIVEEMSHLHHERGISIFLFQDDDFPLFGRVWQQWAREFVAELHAARLPGRIIWKINCRADAVDAALLAEMRDAGLYLVYMGLESGSDEGLKTLNKEITVEQNLAAVAMLKQLGLMFEFGFMMFDPSSTFRSVRDNLEFLRTITGDGSVAAVFCRMLPYDGTPRKDTLAANGRLKGSISDPDYDFLDSTLDRFYAALNRLLHVTGWIHGHRALSPKLNWAWNEVAVIEKMFPSMPGFEAYRQELRELTRESNALLFQIVETLADAYEAGLEVDIPRDKLDDACNDYVQRLVSLRNDFVYGNSNRFDAALSQRPVAVSA